MPMAHGISDCGATPCRERRRNAPETPRMMTACGEVHVKSNLFDCRGMATPRRYKLSGCRQQVRFVPFQHADVIDIVRHARYTWFENVPGQCSAVLTHMMRQNRLAYRSGPETRVQMKNNPALDIGSCRRRVNGPVLHTSRQI